MNRLQDVMDRLAAVDPVAEPSGVGTDDDQREADALLERILAAPAAAPSRGRPRRRWPRLAVATAFGAVILFATFSLLDPDDGHAPNVVARAVAALTQKDAVYHAVFIAHIRNSAYPERRPSPFEETWH